MIGPCRRRPDDTGHLRMLGGLLLNQQAIFDNAGVGILFVRERRILQCNKEASRLFGWPHAEMAGQPGQVFHVSAVDYEAFDRAAAAFLVKGERFAADVTLARRDGSHFLAHVTGCLIDRHDMHAGTIWIVQDVSDVTEQRATRALLERRTAELADANAQLLREIAEREEAQQRVHRLAHFDELTGLPNRRLLLDRLAPALDDARRSGRQLALLFIDLDRFKTVNDTLGHAVGDGLLRGIARRIAAVAHDGDTVARVGGDQFVLTLSQVAGHGDAVALARKTMQTLAMPLHVQGHALHVTCSIGIALFPDHGDAAEALVRSADSAMYHAKAAGQEGYQFFAPPMNASAALRFELENDLHHALRRGGLFLEYQPRVDLADGSFKGVEALVRWRHPQRGLLYPGSFVPLVEETGLIVRLGEWILRRACRQIVDWQEQYGHAIPVAVNLSPRQFRQPLMAEQIGAILAEAGVASNLIELEITESTLMQHTEQTLATLEQLHGMGLKIVIDDFGIGYSSLSYLRRFPVAQLKIDQSFVRELDSDPTSVAIVSAVATLAKNLQLGVVAEGVETLAQLDTVRRCGCGQAQGFLFSRPVSPIKVPLMVHRDWLAAVRRGGT